MSIRTSAEAGPRDWKAQAERQRHKPILAVSADKFGPHPSGEIVVIVIAKADIKPPLKRRSANTYLGAIFNSKNLASIYSIANRNVTTARN